MAALFERLADAHRIERRTESSFGEQRHNFLLFDFILC
jgi:hypothetical protein